MRWRDLEGGGSRTWLDLIAVRQSLLKDLEELVDVLEGERRRLKSAVEGSITMSIMF